MDEKMFSSKKGIHWSFPIKGKFMNQLGIKLFFILNIYQIQIWEESYWRK